MTLTLTAPIQTDEAIRPGVGGAAALRRKLHADGERPDFSPWGRSPLEASSTGRKAPAALVGETIRPSSLAPLGQRPQLHMIKVLHRNHDGYISFALRSEGSRFRPTFAIRASALESMFPGYVDMLTCDSFFSINATHTLARNDHKSDFGRPAHRNETLRYLCACYCDIDLDGDLTFNQAHAKVMDLCEAGVIPWASMVVNSGEGMWLLWLLHDHENQDMPHRGVFSDSEFGSLMVYSQINKAIGSRLRGLGADPNATDGARYIRVPNSYRTDIGKSVWWSLQGQGGRGFSYTLWELADFFGVQVRRLLPAETEATAPKRVMPGRRSGQISANISRLNVILTLIALRGGGFKEPYRDKGAWIYGMALYARKVPLGEAIAAVRSFGRECTPPLSASDCDAQTNSAYRHPGRWSYLKIASTLGVTREEAEIISQRIGKVFPCADGELVEIVNRDGKLKPAERAARRRDELKQIVIEEGRVPPLREMEVMLKARGHSTAGYITVRTDYKLLGLESPRATRLRRVARHRGAQGVLLANVPGSELSDSLQLSAP